MRHDDFHLYCPRKRNRYDGSIAGISRTSLWMIIAKIVPYFVLSCVNLVTILLLSVYVLHVPVAGSLFSLALLSWIFIVVSLLLGLLVSTIARTQVEAMLFSGMVLMMPNRSTFRHDIPHREYASSFTADFKCHPCQMVYCRNQENHD